MRCACESLTVLTGNEAEQYAAEHLEKLEVDPVNWTKRFVCTETGQVWLMDYPRSHLHGGGPPRLQRLDAAGQPVEGPSVDPHR